MDFSGKLNTLNDRRHVDDVARSNLPRGRAVDPRRWHIAWMIGSVVLWLAIAGIVIALVRGWP